MQDNLWGLTLSEDNIKGKMTYNQRSPQHESEYRQFQRNVKYKEVLTLGFQTTPKDCGCEGYVEFYIPLSIREPNGHSFQSVLT